MLTEKGDAAREVTIDPELVLRESTGPASAEPLSADKKHKKAAR
jgi:hypothetical protein